MKPLLLLPLLAGGLLFTGCEVTEVDRRPIAHHRYDYDRSYHRDRPEYYDRADYSDREPYYRTHPVYREGYYERPVEYSSGYERTRSPYYRADVSRSYDSAIHRTYVSNPGYFAAGVTTRGLARAHSQQPPSNEKRRDKDDKKGKKKDRHD